MDRQDSVLSIVNSLGVITDILLGEILAPRFNWTPGHSSRVQARKILETLANSGKITKCLGYYRSLNCRSENKDHAQKLSQCLAEFFKTNLEVIVKREVSLSNGLRPDAAVILLTQDLKCLCVILEVMNTETDNYAQSKINELKRNKELIKTELTQLFGYEIPHFILTVEGKEVKGVIRFQDLIQILKVERWKS